MPRNKKQRPPQDSQSKYPTTKLQPIEKANYTTNKGIRKAVRIIPRNLHQEEYLEYLMDDEKMIVLAQGPAGTGKSVLAMLAGIKALSEKKVSKLILSRPIVGVDDDDLGFIPGTLLDKQMPWVRPLFDVLYEYYSTKEVENMLENQVIEVIPLMHMRGRNIKSAFVILDEAQNTSKNAVIAITTRLCDGSKLVMTGDNDQSDKRSGENGLLIFKNAIKKYGIPQYISSVEFDRTDIERHPVVTEVLNIFDLEK